MPISSDVLDSHHLGDAGLLGALAATADLTHDHPELVGATGSRARRDRETAQALTRWLHERPAA